MRISVEARASEAARDGAEARVVIDAPPTVSRVVSADQARSRIASFVATIVAIASALTSLPELSERLPPRVVMALHFIATVGTSAQPLVVTLAAAVIAAVAERRGNRGHGSA